jgi:hypothetical protein
MPKKTPEQIIQSKVKAYMEANSKLLKKHGLVSRPILRFPNHKKIPVMVRLAMWVIQKYGAVQDTQFTLLKK